MICSVAEFLVSFALDPRFQREEAREHGRWELLLTRSLLP